MIDHQRYSVFESCMSDIKAWSIDQTNLVLNDSKTEFVHIYSNFTRIQPEPPTVNIGNAIIESTQQARNLGVTIDKHLALKDHVKLAL